MAQSDGLIDVSFCCQRCCQPLKINSTLNTIDEQIINELNSEINSNTNRKEQKSYSSKELQKNVIYKVVPPIASKSNDSNGNGFIVIEETNSSLSPSIVKIGLSSDDSNDSKPNSSTVNKQKFNQEINLRQLFDILSDQSDVDHPLCEECADFVIDQMDHQLRQLEDESKDYTDYLNSIQSEQSGDQLVTESEISELSDKLKDLETTERQLMVELKEINEQQMKVDEELERQHNELQRLYAEEDKYWHQYNNVRNHIFNCDDEQQSVDNQLRYAQTLFDKLKRTNVFNATFHIW